MYNPADLYFIYLIFGVAFFIALIYGRIKFRKKTEALVQGLVNTFSGKFIPEKSFGFAKKGNIEINYKNHSYTLKPLNISGKAYLAAIFVDPVLNVGSNNIIEIEGTLNNKNKVIFSASYSDIRLSNTIGFRKLSLDENKVNISDELLLKKTDFLEFIKSVDFNGVPSVNVKVEGNKINLTMEKFEFSIEKWKKYLNFLDAIINKIENTR